MRTQFSSSEVKRAIFTVEQERVGIEVVRRYRDVDFVASALQHGAKSLCTFRCAREPLSISAKPLAIAIIAINRKSGRVESPCSFFRLPMHPAGRVPPPSFFVPDEPNLVLRT